VTGVATDPVRDIRDRGHALRFGFVTPQMWRTWDELVAIWTRAETAGFDLGFVVDHFVSDWDGEAGPVLEAWTLLAALAREVPRLELGTFVSSVTHRPPAVLAKAAVTVDHVSGGRVILGIGAGWNEREHAAYGIAFPPIAERVSRVEETLEALARLEREPNLTYEGTHLRLEAAPFEPKPVRGHLPILVGSTRPRMLRIAAPLADYVDVDVRRLDEIPDVGRRLSADAVAAGRDPDVIRWVSEVVPRADAVTELEDRVTSLAPIGVSVFLVNIWPRSDPAAIDRVGERLEGLRRRWS
jgi:alkanesulfonate monooxygenase SsuD/methylene tetrahydromethanopterin reductase-like flavin-dependent oxidoreductase (luciferase family)